MRQLLAAILALAPSIVLPGCVVESSSGPPPGMAVAGPPPEPVSEARPPPPTPASSWVPGYWHWTGMQYAWIPGHWEAAPPGARWRAPQYSLRDGTYFYEPGGWVPASR
jgi:hypothetical protein